VVAVPFSAAVNSEEGMRLCIAFLVGFFRARAEGSRLRVSGALHRRAAVSARLLLCAHFVGQAVCVPLVHMVDVGAHAGGVAVVLGLGETLCVGYVQT